MNDITVDKISKNDAPCVAKIEKECFSVPFTEEDILAYVENPIWHFLVARQGENVLGYISFTVIIDECQIVNVAVDPSARKRGVGSLLLESFLEYVKALGTKSVFLEVRESNLPAINLYKKFNFEEIGISKNHYSKPTENAILMSLQL